MPLFRVLVVCLIATLPMAAQPRGGPRNVSFGHIHLNSADPDAAMAFWKDVIGAATYTRGTLNGVSTLGLLILFTKNAPAGPSAGTGIDHIGLRVPDLQPVADKLAKTSYKSFEPVKGGDQLTIDGPDGVRIELTADSSMYAPLEFHDIGFHSANKDEAQAWYEKTFGARPGTDDLLHSSRVGGALLAFSQANSVLPTAGRAIDHIAFEIKDLENFCKTLAAAGIKLDSPYRAVPGMGFSAAFLTDPWGTKIEMTEGLAH